MDTERSEMLTAVAQVARVLDALVVPYLIGGSTGFNRRIGVGLSANPCYRLCP